jgi:hypothetical protein
MCSVPRWARRSALQRPSRSLFSGLRRDRAAIRKAIRARQT